MGRIGRSSNIKKEEDQCESRIEIKANNIGRKTL